MLWIYLGAWLVVLTSAAVALVLTTSHHFRPREIVAVSALLPTALITSSALIAYGLEGAMS